MVIRRSRGSIPASGTRIKPTADYKRRFGGCHCRYGKLPCRQGGRTPSIASNPNYNQARRLPCQELRRGLRIRFPAGRSLVFHLGQQESFREDEGIRYCWCFFRFDNAGRARRGEGLFERRRGRWRCRARCRSSWCARGSRRLCYRKSPGRQTGEGGSSATGCGR